jgi:hypothetical protein
MNKLLWKVTVTADIDKRIVHLITMASNAREAADQISREFFPVTPEECRLMPSTIRIIEDRLEHR